jgi:hypothetical protein
LAFQYLKTFEVKKKLIDDILPSGDQEETGDQEERIVAMEVTRKKVLRKLDREDEDPPTIQEDLKKAGTAIKDYVPSSRKLRALRDLREAKNHLIKSGLEERGPGWLARNMILATDPEEEKAQLLDALRQGIADGQLDGDDSDIIIAMAYLRSTEGGDGVKRV